MDESPKKHSTIFVRDNDEGGYLEGRGSWGDYALRVVTAFAHAARLLGVPASQLSAVITCARDHEGALELEWTRTPTEAEKWAFGEAWEGSAREDRQNVTHEVK